MFAVHLVKPSIVRADAYLVYLTIIRQLCIYLVILQRHCKLHEWVCGCVKVGWSWNKIV